SNYASSCLGYTTLSFTPPPGLDGEYSTGQGCGNGGTYQFTVPNMDYLVNLKFAEPSYATSGQRLFMVSVNGTTNSDISSVDVEANAGGQYKPWDAPTIPVTVTNGQIVIQLSPIVNAPIINAVEIVAANSVLPVRSVSATPRQV